MVLHTGRGTRFLRALCGGLLTRLEAGASLESLIDEGTAASAERRQLVRRPTDSNLRIDSNLTQS